MYNCFRFAWKLVVFIAQTVDNKGEYVIWPSQAFASNTLLSYWLNKLKFYQNYARKVSAKGMTWTEKIIVRIPCILQVL